MAVYAEDGVGSTGSLETSSTPQVETLELEVEPVGPPVEGDSAPPVEGEGEDTGTPIVTEAPAGGQDTLAMPSAVGAMTPMALAAVLPGTSTNLNLTLEGVRKDMGWVTGNLKQYAEGEWVPYRLVMKNKSSVDSVTIPLTTIEFDHYVNGKGITYDSTRSWGTYITTTQPAGGDSRNPSTTAATPSSQDVPTGGALGTAPTIKTSFPAGFLVIPPGEYGVLYFQAHLAVTSYWNMQSPSRNGAGFVPGSSGHVSLDMKGFGKKTVPIPSVPKPTHYISGVKFNDVNRNGVKNTGEPTLSGWTITLQGSNIGTLTTVTGANGAFKFGPLPSGTYSLNEIQQAGWTNSTPLPATINCNCGNKVQNIGNYHNDVQKTFELTYAGIPANAQPYVRYAINGGANKTIALTGSPLKATVPVPHGASLTKIEWRATYGTEDVLLGVSPTPEVLNADVTNRFTYTASLAGSKFNDLDADGIWGQNEPGLPGWTIKLLRGGAPYAETITGAGGAYAFTGLLPGSYTLSEVQQGGWVDTVAPQGATTVTNGTAGTGLDFGNTEVLPEIKVTKTALPTQVPETGGSVNFSFTITNKTSAFPLTVTSIVDNKFGDLLATAKSQNGGLDIVLAPNASYTFSVARTLSSDLLTPHINTVIVTAVDEFGRSDTDDDHATVTFTDVAPEIRVIKTALPSSVPETGGDVVFTITVENIGTEAVDLTNAVDSVFGPIPVASFDKTSLAVGEMATYSFTEFMAGEPNAPHHNEVIVTAVDNEGTEASDDDDADVDYIDVRPTVEVVKEVTPAYLDEPGGTFTYQVRVKNTSAESVKLTIVEDNVYGVLYEWTAGDPEIWMLPNAVRIFDFTMDHTDTGEYKNIAEATVVDNEGNEASDDDDATALVGDVAPIVEIDKTVGTASLAEPGGDFTFTLTIKNAGVVPFTITSLTDSNLTMPYPAEVAALIGQTIVPGAQLSASYTLTHVDAGTYDNVAVVEVIDNDGATDTDTDDETVTVTDVLPQLEVTKEVAPASMPEPGGTFTYQVRVKNTSAESVKLTIVEDNVYGVLYEWTAGDPEIWMLPNAVRIFDFTMDHTDAGEYKNTAAATVVDNEENSASDSDDATATVVDIPPAVQIDKSVDTTSLPQPGGDFTFTLTIKNIGVEPFTITSLTDSNLTEPYPAEVAALIGQTIAPDDEISASYTLTHTEVGTYENVAVVEVMDNEESTATDTDDETVTVVKYSGDLVVYKFHDLNENGEYDEGEPMLEDWEFTLSKSLVPVIAPVAIMEADSGFTDENGELPFGELYPGGYTVTETLQDGWTNTTPLSQSAIVVDGETTELWFGNIEEYMPYTDGRVLVHKFEDLNENGIYDEGEPMLKGWEFTLTQSSPPIMEPQAIRLVDSGYTGTDGTLLFDELPLGDYTVTETLQDGWINTTPLTQLVTVVEEGIAHVWFGNVEEPYMPFTEPDLAITKSVDKTTAKPGELLTYTLTYQNIGDAAAYDFTIVDDYDQRYVTVVDAAGGTIAGGKISWNFAGPLSKADGKETITFTVRVNKEMPVGTTSIDNIVTIVDPHDGDPSNNTDRVRTAVRIAGETEPFLPFTGGEYLLLIGLAAIAATAGALFRLRSRSAA